MTSREQVVKLVDRFLAWPLPQSVCSDLCATKQGYPHRSGTTLLSADEAKQMVEYLFSDIETDADLRRRVEELVAVRDHQAGMLNDYTATLAGVEKERDDAVDAREGTYMRVDDLRVQLLAKDGRIKELEEELDTWKLGSRGFP
jgi:hypothetical protein